MLRGVVFTAAVERLNRGDVIFSRNSRDWFNQKELFSSKRFDKSLSLRIVCEEILGSLFIRYILGSRMFGPLDQLLDVSKIDTQVIMKTVITNTVVCGRRR